jgi:predicted dehydrogenase
MLRLALVGCADGGGAYPRLAPRLRGARFTAAVPADFDAVIIRPADDALALCLAAAAAGKHVLVEGPLACSVGDLKRLLAACAATGVRLMAGQSFRFLPSLRVVKESLDAGRLGEPGLLRVHHWQPAGLPTGGLVPEADLACWLFGQHPTEVYAASHQLPDGPNYVQLHLGFSRGGMALIDHARTLPPGDSYFSLSLIGSAGAAYADDHHNTQLLFGGGHPVGLLTGQADATALAQLQEFVSAIQAGREPSVTGADWLRAAKVAEAAAESAATGQALRWDGERYGGVPS